MLRLTPRKGGYLVVMLCAPGERPKQYRVNRLVLMAFDRLPGPEEVCRHLNGDPADNCATNLAWGTELENAADTIRHGRNTQLQKDECPSGHSYLDPNNVRLYRGKRYCRECTRHHGRRRYWRLKGEAA